MTQIDKDELHKGIKITAMMKARLANRLREVHGDKLLDSPKSSDEIRVTYLPKPRHESWPPEKCYFGAVIKKTGMAILFKSDNDVSPEVAVEAMAKAPMDQWRRNWADPAAQAVAFHAGKGDGA